jgi:hypothetical protein
MPTLNHLGLPPGLARFACWDAVPCPCLAAFALLECETMGVQAKGFKRGRNLRVLQGLQKRGQALGSFRLDGKPYDAESLSQALQAHLDALDRVDSLHANLAEAVRVERALEAKTADLVRAFRDHLLYKEGPQGEVLATYGFRVPRKTGPKTNIAKVISAARMRATRKERGTMGKRQRKKRGG